MAWFAKGVRVGFPRFFGQLGEAQRDPTLPLWNSSGQQPVRYYYHKDGKVERQDHSNGTTTAFGYDGRGMISSVHHKRTANGANLSYRDYWRDNRDRITAWKKSSDSIVNRMENGRGDRYAYDEAGQLTTARYQAQNPQGNATSPERGDDFVYDALGNRKGNNNWVASRGQMLNFTIKENGLNEYGGWSPYSVIRHDEDVGMPWGMPQHANGTIMEEGWITGGFNALNQPIQIFGKAYLGTPNWMWFGFDPLGRCVKRWVTYPGGPDTGATYYYYDGWNLLQEGASPASVQRLYIHGARVDEIVKSFNYTTSQSAWHHYDARGHCTMLTGPNGEILEQYDYDAFGFPYFYDGQGNAKTFYDAPSNSVRGYSPYGNRFLFTGREWLTDLKLYDYRNRMYHPELGRFLQPDPKHFTAGAYNIYRYCGNDPVNKNDPLGFGALSVNFPDYSIDTGIALPIPNLQMSTPGGAMSFPMERATLHLPLGHAGVAAVYPNGKVSYYEFGRYDGTPGKVRTDPVPDLVMDKDGNPTKESFWASPNCSDSW